MKRDEPFDPSIKSGPPPEGLIFRLARREDCIFISDLLSERNPSLDIADILASTNREIDRVETDGGYKLYVVEFNSEVIGFCRFYIQKACLRVRKYIPVPKVGTAWGF